MDRDNRKIKNSAKGKPSGELAKPMVFAYHNSGTVLGIREGVIGDGKPSYPYPTGRFVDSNTKS